MPDMHLQETVKMSATCVTILTPVFTLKKWQMMLYTASTSATCIAAMVLNAFLILSMYKTKQLINNFNILLLCHSIAECCYAGNRQALTIVQWLSSEPSCRNELIMQFFALFLPHTSGLLIVATAVCRMVHIKFSNNVVYHLSKFKLCIILFCCLFIAFLIGMSYTLATVNDIYHQVNIILLTADFVFLLMGLLSYLYLYGKVFSHVKNSSTINRCKSAAHQEKNGKVHHEAVSMTKVINQLIIVLFISYIPYIFIGLIFSSQPHTCNHLYKNIMNTFVLITFLPIYIAPSMNAIIFVRGNKKCKRYIWRFLSRMVKIEENKNS